MPTYPVAYHVRQLYAAGGFDLERPPGPFAFIRTLIGNDAFDWTDDAGGDSRLFFYQGAWCVRTPRSLTGERLCVSLGHIVVRWYLFTVLQEETPPPIDEFVAEFLVPSPALTLAIESLEGDTPAIAAHFRVPETMIALRLRRFLAKAQSGSWPRIVCAG